MGYLVEITDSNILIIIFDVPHTPSVLEAEVEVTPHMVPLTPTQPGTVVINPLSTLHGVQNGVAFALIIHVPNGYRCICAYYTCSK